MYGESNGIVAKVIQEGGICCSNIKNVIGKALEPLRRKTSRHGINSLKYQGDMSWTFLGDNFKDALTLNDFKNYTCE